MKTIELTDIELRGSDAQGRYAMALLDGEWVGVSLDGEDECVRDLSDVSAGDLVEVGVERMLVVENAGQTHKSLEDILAYMQTPAGREDDCADLQTFGGTDPRKMDGWTSRSPVWSWDDERALIGEGSDSLEIVQIADMLGASKAAATLGRKGGAAKSTAKTDAARANGARGGRPRKTWTMNYRTSEWDVIERETVAVAPFAWQPDRSDNPLAPTQPTQLRRVRRGPKGAEWIRFVAEYQDGQPVGYASEEVLSADHEWTEDVDYDWE